MKEKGKKDSNSISNQFYKYLANDTNKKAIQNEVIKFNNIYDSKETIETSEKKDEKIGKKMTIDLQFGKLKKGEPNFSIGDIGYAFRDKWIRTNELANDIRIELAKIYTSLGQIFTAESIQNGNLELKENMELFKYIANNKLKKSRDIDVEMNNNQNPESLASAEN
jgi:predicted translin family RNA/ssDNA-binding protein